MATVTDTSVVITWFTGSSTETDEYGFPAPVATDAACEVAAAPQREGITDIEAVIRAGANDEYGHDHVRLSARRATPARPVRRRQQLGAA
ncbi:MAG TPA: hypothetical protein VME44_11875 [Streptosporangiaceae bacterium]|nr:hypothetical protein [Streptosporangiaceae bacterium]